jgi:hypothetical protein
MVGAQEHSPVSRHLRTLDPALPAPSGSTPIGEQSPATTGGATQRTTSDQASAFAAASMAAPFTEASTAAGAAAAGVDCTKQAPAAAAAVERLRSAAAAELGAEAADRGGGVCAAGTRGRVSFEISSVQQDGTAEQGRGREFRGQMVTRANSTGASSTGRSVYLMNESSTSSFGGGGYHGRGREEEGSLGSSLGGTMEVESVTPPGSSSQHQEAQVSGCIYVCVSSTERRKSASV